MRLNVFLCNKITYQKLLYHFVHKIDFIRFVSTFKMQSNPYNSTSSSKKEDNTTLDEVHLSIDDPRRTTLAADNYRIKTSCSNNVNPSRADEKKNRTNTTYWQNKYGGSSSDDDDNLHKRQRTSRVVTRSKARSNNNKKKLSSKSIKPQLYLDVVDEVEIMKVKKVTEVSRYTPVDSKQTSKSSTRNTLRSSVTTPTAPLGIECLGFVSPSPPFSKQPLCNHCGNRGYACHNKVYSTYCTKACLDYLQNNTNHWLSGFDPNTMEQVFTSAYNEKRRVELEENHGYYCPNKFGLPMCMKNDSMNHAINLGDNPRLCKDLEEHNEGGRTRWLDPKKNYRS